MRKLLLAGNWKMYKTPDEAVSFFEEFLPLVDGVCNRDILFFVPAIDLAVSLEKVKGTSVQVGAQNAHWEKEGAFTGEISLEMLRAIQCPWVLVGHSERREYFGETNESTNKKMKAAFAHEIYPILCVGETLAEREAGETGKKVTTQIREGLAGLTLEEAKKTVVAYEPIWAIGTGKTATSEDAQLVCHLIRETLKEMFGPVSEEIRILYGGSVKPENATELLAQVDIDGALVGGASLKAEDFAKIVKA